MVAMPRFRTERCFSVWNGFFGQVEFGLDRVLSGLALSFCLIPLHPFGSLLKNQGKALDILYLLWYNVVI